MSHPAASLPAADRAAYLRAVAALVTADGEVATVEVTALRALAEELGAPDGYLDALAQVTDDALVDEALARVERLALGHALLTDAITLAFADDTLAPEESQALARFAQRLRVPIAQVGMLARYVGGSRAGGDDHGLARALTADLVAAQVPSPGFVRGLLARLHLR